MANLSLAQLRDAQKANPPSVDADGVLSGPAWFGIPTQTPDLVAAMPILICPPVSAAGPSPAGSLPLQASPPVPAAVPGGYCRIFPAHFPSIADIPQAWKDEFWSCNSQWCHVEGSQRHPDFEANLLAVEAEVDEKCKVRVDKLS